MILVTTCDRFICGDIRILLAALFTIALCAFISACWLGQDDSGDIAG